MSAITGIGDSTTIVLSASTSLSRGTATRTTSAPASATVRIWSMVAWRFAVSVLVIVWTTTGAPPPIWTSPTITCRSEAIAIQCTSAAASRRSSRPRSGACPADLAGAQRPVVDADRCRCQKLPVHRVDRGGVLLLDRPPLELHRRRQLLAARQPVAAHEREALDLLDARQPRVGGV